MRLPQLLELVLGVAELLDEAAALLLEGLDALGALLLVGARVFDGGRTFGLGNDDFAQIVQLSAIAALLATGFLVTRGRISETLRNAALWLLIMLVFVAGYVYRDDLQSVAGRMTAGLVPGRAVMVTDAAGEQILVLHKMDHGHFQANVQINGGTVPMLVDTGASAVVLSYADAERLGLQPETLDFNQMVSTANGTALAAPIRLDSLAIGHAGPAAIAPDRGGEHELIGIRLGIARLEHRQVRLEPALDGFDVLGRKHAFSPGR